MGFSNILDNPFTSLTESFVKNVIMDTVKPEVGSILKVDLAGGFASHTGVYIGNNKIVELYENDRKGKIRIVSPRIFLRGELERGELGSAVRTGVYIYCACNDDLVLYSDEIAERATYCVGDEVDYELVGKNCHSFITYCITGKKVANKNANGRSLWTLMDVEDSLEKYFGLSVNAVTWRSTGSANGESFE